MDEDTSRDEAMQDAVEFARGFGMTEQEAWDWAAETTDPEAAERRCRERRRAGETAN